MSIIYDNSNAADMLKEKYKQTYKKPPTQAVNQVISLLDDIILGEWEKCMSLLDLEAQKFASQTLAGLEQKTICDQRVQDALQAYITIVQMEFETPQQKLQNIRNASYFIWALFAPNSNAANVFFNDYGKETLTDINQNFGRSN